MMWVQRVVGYLIGLHLALLLMDDNGSSCKRVSRALKQGQPFCARHPRVQEAAAASCTQGLPLALKVCHLRV
eukprot:1161278-Pelagomonas_calceolata.AAC.1